MSFNHRWLGFLFQVTGMTPLMYAVKDNRTTFIDRMLDLGVDITARNYVSYISIKLMPRHVSYLNFNRE